MNMDKVVSLGELLTLLNAHSHTELHVHHTWKPAHSSFNGSNHLAIQSGMRNHHVNTNGWDDIAQHVTLTPDGKFVTGRAFSSQPASIKGYNDTGINDPFMVEMVGNFDEKGVGAYNNLGYDKLEGKQLDSILRLSKYFNDKGKYIRFHNENSGKTCPGTSINKEDFMKQVESLDKKELQTPSPWAREAVTWAIEKKLTDGSDIKEPINMERFLTVLHRIYVKGYLEE